MKCKLISVFNQKGGCGKSMTSMQLAADLALRGYRTLVVDMDKQGTAAIWSSKAPADDPFPARVMSLAVQKEGMIQEVKKFSSDYHIIIIDCPPAIGSVIPWAALNISDLGLIPVIPVLDNIWASKEACELGLEAAKKNPALDLAYVICMLRRGNLFENCLGVIKEDARIKTLNSTIGMRNAFPESQAYGTSVHGLSKRSVATKEIEALASEVLSKLKLKEYKDHG